jgi:hypothetical protein
MAMQKFGDVEKIEVLKGKEAQVLNQHMNKLGKYKVSDFSKEEKQALQQELESVRPQEDEDAEDGS